jgi:hypothetical protein
VERALLPAWLAVARTSGHECPLHIETLWLHTHERARENCNSNNEADPRVESVRPWRHVVRAVNDLLTQLR